MTGKVIAAAAAAAVAFYACASLAGTAEAEK